MPRVRFTRRHNGFESGEEVDFDNGTADAIVNWARAGEYVTAPQMLPPAITPQVIAALDGPPMDKMMPDPARNKGGRPKGSKNKPRLNALSK